jgi:hypothetical protein
MTWPMSPELKRLGRRYLKTNPSAVKLLREIMLASRFRKYARPCGTTHAPSASLA